MAAVRALHIVQERHFYIFIVINTPLTPHILPRWLLDRYLWLEFLRKLRERITLVQVYDNIFAEGSIRLGAVQQELVQARRQVRRISEQCAVFVTRKQVVCLRQWTFHAD